MLTWMLRLIALSWILLSQACGGGWVSPGDDQVGDDGGGDDDAADAGVSVDAVPWTEVVLSVCHDGSQPYTTIGEALAAAPDASTIEVCAGTYGEQLTITGRSIQLVGAGAGATILDAGNSGTGLVVTGSDAVVVEGFTIRNGNAAGPGGAVRCEDSALIVRTTTILASRSSSGGGGLYGLRCAVDISNARFEANEGADYGGGALLSESTGSISDTIFTGNSADEGGALYLLGGAVDVHVGAFTDNLARARGGALYQASDSTIDDSRFTQNRAEWTGGAVYLWQHAPKFHRVTFALNASAWEGGGMYSHQSEVVIEDSAFVDNTSVDDGGGLRLFETRGRITRTEFSRNRATEGDGGAFKSSHLPTVFTDCQLLDNQAYGAGGGAEFDNDSSLWRGGVISGNRASIGGGVHAMRWPWNDGLIEGVRITDNTAWRGGGVYLEDHFQLVTMRGVLVDDNHANQAAGIYVRGTPLRLSGSVISRNRADDVGGGVFTAPSSDYPWSEPCPCPPVDPAAKISFVVVDGNTADAGAAVWNKAPNVTFESSIFAGHTGNAVTVPLTGAAPTWRYNDTFPATFAGMAEPTGDGNLSTDPAFVAAGDFHLAPTSICRNAGDPAFTDPDGTRADMGAYAGPTPMP